MKELVQTLDVLRKPASPLQFLVDGATEKDTGTKIINEIREALDATTGAVAISAPQLGIDARIFCIKFNDVVKTFINPIVIKKANYVIRPETFIGMPGKEILITRPEEVTVVYYTDEFKYEENKLLGAAARVFDQQYQLLDGILPDDLGLVSDVEADGSLADCSDDEIAELSEFYKKYIETKTAAAKANLQNDPESEKQYNSLRFTENVINGRASVVANDLPTDVKASAALAAKKAGQAQNDANRAKLMGRRKK